MRLTYWIIPADARQPLKPASIEIPHDATKRWLHVRQIVTDVTLNGFRRFRVPISGEVCDFFASAEDCGLLPNARAMAILGRAKLNESVCGPAVLWGGRVYYER